MGKRSGIESVSRVLLALARDRTCTQAGLAAEVGISVAAVRRHLRELLSAGVPLERQEEWPDVHWSVPRGWFPGGTALGAPDCVEIARLLGRLPRSAARERAIRKLLGRAAEAGRAANARSDEVAEGVLEAAEDACTRRVALFIRSFSAGRGELGDRHVSVHRIEHGPRARWLATCHRSGALKWFRVDRVESARVDDGEAFREVEPGDVERVLAESVDGFRGEGRAVECAFWVRDPEARWVARNLPARMALESRWGEAGEPGTRFSTRTGGLEVLARFVVGLGDAAVVETPELAQRVEALARGALVRAERRSDARSGGVVKAQRVGAAQAGRVRSVR
jgi:predicted DNA-binding transcriptional regulator YafY